MRANYRIFTTKSDLLNTYEEMCRFLNTLSKDQVISITNIDTDFVIWFWQFEEFLEIEE